MLQVDIGFGDAVTPEPETVKTEASCGLLAEHSYRDQPPAPATTNQTPDLLTIRRSPILSVKKSMKVMAARD